MRNGKFRSRLETLPPDSRQQVIDEIGRLVNEESHGAEFALTVKADVSDPQEGAEPVRLLSAGLENK